MKYLSASSVVVHARHKQNYESMLISWEYHDDGNELNSWKSLLFHTHTQRHTTWSGNCAHVMFGNWWKTHVHLECVWNEHTPNPMQWFGFRSETVFLVCHEKFIVFWNTHTHNLCTMLGMWIQNTAFECWPINKVSVWLELNVRWKQWEAHRCSLRGRI